MSGINPPTASSADSWNLENTGTIVTCKQWDEVNQVFRSGLARCHSALLPRDHPQTSPDFPLRHRFQVPSSTQPAIIYFILILELLDVACLCGIYPGWVSSVFLTPDAIVCGHEVMDRSRPPPCDGQSEIRAL